MTEDQAAIRVAAKLTGDLTGLAVLDATGRVRHITGRYEGTSAPSWWWAECHGATALLIAEDTALEMAERLQAAGADMGT